MMRAFIFANGKMEGRPPLIKDIHSSDLLIAVDGGSQLCKSLGFIPNLIIGDLDSLDQSDVTLYKQSGVKVIQHPTNKDETDLELALNITLQHEVTHVFIFGALGARWDMTFANVLLATLPRYSKLHVYILDGLQELFIMRGDDRYEIEGRSGEVLSLIPLVGDTRGITTRGVLYPLTDETLYFGSPRGVSNKIIDTEAEICVREGILLIYLSSEKK